LSLQTLVNTAPNDPIFNNFVDVVSGQSQEEIDDAEDENLQIDSLFTDNSSSSSSGSSSGIDGDFDIPKKRFKVDNSIDDVEYTDDLLKGNFNNLNNQTSGMPPPTLPLNPNLINPLV
jgi:hypothetical protein